MKIMFRQMADMKFQTRSGEGMIAPGQYEAKNGSRSAQEIFNEIIITQMAFWYNDALGHLKRPI